MNGISAVNHLLGIVGLPIFKIQAFSMKELNKHFQELLDTQGNLTQHYKLTRHSFKIFPFCHIFSNINGHILILVKIKSTS